MTRQITDAEVAFTASKESFRALAYDDAQPNKITWGVNDVIKGTPTIGYGETRGVTASDVRKGRTVTKQWAEDMLRRRLQGFADEISALDKSGFVDDLTPNQWTALVDFAYNIGVNPDATIWKRLNAKQFDQVPVELIRFVYSKGVKLQGLVNRRTAEIQLWSKDEPGSVDASVPSTVTQASETFAIPVDPQPVAQKKSVWAAVAGGVALAPQAVTTLQGTLDGVRTSAANYSDHSHVAAQVVGWLSTAGFCCVVAVPVLIWMKKRAEKHQ